MIGINTIYFPPALIFCLNISGIPCALSIFLLSFSYCSIFSFLISSSSIEFIFSNKFSILPSVFNVYSQDTIFGFTTKPNFIASTKSISIAICSLLCTSSFVYPSFKAISSAIFLSSMSLVGVAVIPNTFVFSSWLSNNLFNFPSHLLAPVLCNSSNTIKPYLSFITSFPLCANNPGYVSNLIFGNTSAIISSFDFPSVPCLPCIYSIIRSLVCSSISFCGARYSIGSSLCSNSSVKATKVFPAPVGKTTDANLFSSKISSVFSTAFLW